MTVNGTVKHIFSKKKKTNIVKEHTDFHLKESKRESTLVKSQMF